jgi:hypothetical protein
LLLGSVRGFCLAFVAFLGLFGVSRCSAIGLFLVGTSVEELLECSYHYVVAVLVFVYYYIFTVAVYFKPIKLLSDVRVN